MRGSSSTTRRGVKPRDTNPRMRPCIGGSMARNDIVRCAWGPDAAGSSDTPCAAEKRAESRKPATTSAWRDRAQKASAPVRDTGASSGRRREGGEGSVDRERGVAGKGVGGGVETGGCPIYEKK